MNEEIQSSHTIFSMCMSILVISISLFLIFTLYNSSNKHPNKNISSFWVIIILIDIIIHQICSLLIFNIRTSEYIQIIHTSIMNNTRLICLLMRSISIHQSISYTHHILLRRFSYDSFYIEEDKDFARSFFTRRFKYLKLFIVLLVLLLLASLLCIFIDNVRNGILNHFNLNLQSSFSDLILGLVIFNLIFFTLLIPYFYYTISVFKYTLQNDLFKIKYELAGSFLITYLSYNIQEIVIISDTFAMNKHNMFLFEMSSNLCLVTLILILTIIRHINFKRYSIEHLLNDFNLSMKTDITLKLFKDYIKVNNVDYYRYLNFWVDFIRYENRVEEYKQIAINIKNSNVLTTTMRKYSDEPSLSSANKNLLLEQEKPLRDLAKIMFKDYFQYNSTSEECLTTGLTIEFPTDILEKVEEQYKNDFAEGCFESIFRESFNWVYCKLKNLYTNFIASKVEKEKLERILFYVICFEICSVDYRLYTLD